MRVGSTSSLHASRTNQKAYEAVLAQRHDMSMEEIAEYTARPKGKFPMVTEAMIDFLQKNAAENNGRLRYSNDDMALWLGYEGEKTRRPLGNWMSRLDFAGYWPICRPSAKLPPSLIGTPLVFQEASTGTTRARSCGARRKHISGRMETLRSCATKRAG